MEGNARLTIVPDHSLFSTLPSIAWAKFRLWP
jgi:hypothetical protein